MSDAAYRVTGPAAVGEDWRRSANLTLTLARMDWKVRFFGSALGYLWSLLRPLMLFGILFFVFSEVVGAGDGVAHFPIVLLTGMMLYFFFGEVTGAGVTSPPSDLAAISSRSAAVQPSSYWSGSKSAAIDSTSEAAICSSCGRTSTSLDRMSNSGVRTS